MRWDRINEFGWKVEHTLAWVVLVALLVLGLLTLLRAEWALVPAAARTEIICGELLIEHAHQAPLAFADPELARTDAAFTRELEECEHSPHPAIVPPVPDLLPFN